MEPPHPSVIYDTKWPKGVDRLPGGPDEHLPDPEEPVVSGRGVIAHPESAAVRHRFSLGATFLGWVVAAFFTFVLSAFVVAFSDGVALDGTIDISAVAIGQLLSYLVVAFAAYLIGGYAAGRIALWDGVLHGMLTVAWAVLFGGAVILAGAAITGALDARAYVPIEPGAITGGSLLAVVVSLIAMLAGGGLGGLIGERYHERAHEADRGQRPSGPTRSRPL